MFWPYIVFLECAVRSYLLHCMIDTLIQMQHDKYENNANIINTTRNVKPGIASDKSSVVIVQTTTLQENTAVYSYIPNTPPQAHCPTMRVCPREKDVAQQFMAW